MQPIGQLYDWVYAGSNGFACVRIAGNSYVIRRFKTNLEKWGDLFFPVASGVPETDIPLECFKCGRRHGLLQGKGYVICPSCKGGIE